MISEEQMEDKLDMLEQELKRLELWQKNLPSWISNYDTINWHSATDFVSWLQFVFIPNQRQLELKNGGSRKRYHLVPSAIRFFGNQIHNGKLLQILIEIDATI